MRPPKDEKRKRDGDDVDREGRSSFVMKAEFLLFDLPCTSKSFGFETTGRRWLECSTLTLLRGSIQEETCIQNYVHMSDCFHDADAAHLALARQYPSVLQARSRSSRSDSLHKHNQSLSHMIHSQCNVHCSFSCCASHHAQSQSSKTCASSRAAESGESMKRSSIASAFCLTTKRTERKVDQLTTSMKAIACIAESETSA